MQSAAQTKLILTPWSFVTNMKARFNLDVAADSLRFYFFVKVGVNERSNYTRKRLAFNTEIVLSFRPNTHRPIG